jgi:hypothetical protein
MQKVIIIFSLCFDWHDLLFTINHHALVFRVQGPSLSPNLHCKKAKHIQVYRVPQNECPITSQFDNTEKHPIIREDQTETYGTCAPYCPPHQAKHHSRSSASIGFASALPPVSPWKLEQRQNHPSSPGALKFSSILALPALSTRALFCWPRQRPGNTTNFLVSTALAHCCINHINSTESLIAQP